MNAPSGKVVVAYVDVGLWLSSVGMSTSTIALIIRIMYSL